MKHRCPVCDSGELEIFFSAKQVPVIINILSNSKEEAMSRPRGDIDLGFCDHCGHIYNTSFDLGLLDYSGEYDNSLHFSTTFRSFANELAQTMVTQRGWANSSLLEVGCGKADFLKLLCELGGNKGIGFDPSIDSVDWQSIGDKGGAIKLVRGYFGKEDIDIPGGRVICQHVLEHIETPANFLQEIIASRSNYPTHSVYFEVPNVLYSLRDFGIWDIIYEHCSYFSPSSLRYLFSRFGYAVDSCEEVYGKQFLSLHADLGQTQETQSGQDVSELKSLVEQYSLTFGEKLKQWERNLASACEGKSKSVVWGAGSKGITFLNLMTDDRGIDYIIDQNPAKTGKYVAGTGQKIETPQFLTDYQPDQVIIMNPLYKKEIEELLKTMGLAPQILVA